MSIWSANDRRKANWARLIHTVYETDPLNCTRYDATRRIIAVIDDVGVVERGSRRLVGPNPQQARAIAGDRAHATGLPWKLDG